MISFVYFDVGGVVIDDFSGNGKWVQLKRELGVKPADSEAFDKLFDSYVRELCIDRDVESLIPIFKNEFDLQIPASYSLLEGFVKRFYANRSIWPVVEYVRERTRIGLLTNMYPGMFDAVSIKGIMPGMEWDVVIDSTVVGLQKPDRELFEHARQSAGVPMEEILLVDNGVGHIREATSCGWQGYLYDSYDLEESSRKLQHFFNTHELSRDVRSGA